MAASEDLIDFDIIEGQKENIQSLPGGRSAKKLAQLYSPNPLQKLSTPTPADTKDANDAARAEYEAELAAVSESDDPLDVFDRYVRWTLDTYPSAQATPQSQLHILLERATRAFIGSNQYKNDPRYLKIWMHYIHFFSDAPRETFLFLSRHNIGEGLALFYEEYAAWLESAGRWNQAEEVYKLGIEREARPAARLIRKFGEFEQRREQQPDDTDTPSSPALPTMRPALAAKIDPFAAASRAADPQAPRSNMGVGGPSSKPAKSKLAIFSDADSEAPAMSSRGGSKGWDTIGSLADRKKENTMEPKPWAGETLKAGGKKSSAPKLAIFRDPSLARIAESHIVIAPSKHQVIVNPVSGRRERVFVNLEAVYPTPEEPGTELSFEELWAAGRGWLDVDWADDESEYNHAQTHADENALDLDVLNHQVQTKLVVHHDMPMLDENGAIKDQQKSSKPKKKKMMMEVNETQIIKAKLDSPSGRKIRKRSIAEPTLTLHTRAATEEIYDIFNAPLKPSQDHDDESDDDEYMTDGDYTSGGESTCTTRQISVSEAGDDEISDVKSVSEWSDFTARKHIPKMEGEDEESDGEEDGEEGNNSQMSDLIDARQSSDQGTDEGDYSRERQTLVTPTEQSSPRTRTMFVPIPPEDYVPQTRPYRDPAEVANNRLPFMTPITERTEMSLGVLTAARLQYPYTTTPGSFRSGVSDDIEEDDEDFEPISSPLREILKDDRSPVKIPQPILQKSTQPAALAKPIPKGPIIKELQCNPCDLFVRTEILENTQPPLASYAGFYQHQDTRYNRSADIRKFSKSGFKAGKNGTCDRSSMGSNVVLEFPEIHHNYTLKKELGAGAFAPVYLVENSAPEGIVDGEQEPLVEMGKGAFATAHRGAFEALKMEQPPSPWEFYMMRLAATRLGPHERAMASISVAHELHLYQDEGFLFLQYHPHGTLLDVINFFREQPSQTMDEPLAMFFTIELLRTVEALHAKNILHGDLKVDNCLLRLDPVATGADGASLSSQWHADGSGGWASRGVVLIDFGRGIDMRAFDPNVQFIADWKTTAADCAEMREGRPWTWQIDYHGLAGIIHCLLFGKYIETMRCDQGGLGTSSGRRYRTRESLKRYWQTDIWSACFDLLLNPGSFAAEGSEGAEGGSGMPVTRGLRVIREQMEEWLEKNCEKGVGLRSLVGRVEGYATARAGRK
ncbi:Mad3/BUB1 homology region 1-domain-containing protein [Xylariales sp. PMI_506]|nr:Mad3/BUB1 homology region 1-domain-containing protein [Xylariales sp. PMI_506]